MQGGFLRLVVLAVPVAACAANSAPRSPEAAKRAVIAASAAFDDAQLHKYRVGMDHFLAADFKFVRGSGKLSGRNDFMAGFTDPQVSFKPFTITNRIFVPLGTTGGIVGGEGVIQGLDHGQPFKEHFRYSDTFQWRDGRWQVVYVQVTPLNTPL